MRAAYSIAKREVFSYFVSPIAYVVNVVWLLWCGLQYYLMAGFFAGSMNASASGSPLTAFFGGSVLFFIPLLVFAPVLTMRLLAEERHTGTLEPLLTAPVTRLDVVLGKYAAAMVFWCVLWIPTVLYVWLTSQFGTVDMGAVLASYIGVFGIGLYYMAIGLAMSALAKNQIVAALLTFMVLAGLFAVRAALVRRVVRQLPRRARLHQLVGAHAGLLEGHRGFSLRGLRHQRRGSVRVPRLPRARRQEVAVSTPEKSKGSATSRGSFDGWALLTTTLVAVLVVLVNYVSARRYERWDLTRDRLFTLSERTEKLLQGLSKPVDIYVFMGSGEPTYHELRELVTRYKAKTDKITAHFVDPDREPTKFRVLAEKFGVRVGMQENGATEAELAVLVTSGDKRWSITRDDLVAGRLRLARG